MNPFVKWYVKIQILSALVVIGLQGFVYKHFHDFIVNYPFLALLAAGTTYLFLYRGLYLLYDLVLWKKILNKYNIQGKWFHEFGSRQHPDYCRRGITRIEQTALKVSFKARNYDKDFKDINKRTHWHDSHIAVMEGGRLFLEYNATDFDNRFKKGVMEIQLDSDGGRPKRMTGIFYDTSEPYMVGTVTWWRKPDWDTSKIEHKF